MTSETDFSADESFELLTAEAMVRVNELCDVFEQRIRSENPITVAQFLRDQDLPEGHEFRVLIRELLVIDLHHRVSNGETPRVEDYACLTVTLSEAVLNELIGDACKDIESDVGVLLPSQRIGDYLVVEEIGRGGMGQVCRAVHLLMHREVAIKMLTTKVSKDPLARRRFEREIQSVAKLSHRNIVTAFDARLDDDSLYLVTEWIEGSDLSRLVQKEGPLPVNVVLDYAKQAARGLRYAHDQGLIHRDVKPGNLLVDQQGVLKVLDLGLAKLLYDVEEDEASPDALTKSTHIIGTPAFLAPEQARSALSADTRCDVYSLGCTLYFLLTGQTPYKGSNAVDTILSHTESPTPVVSDRRSDIPEAVSNLVYDMMRKEPDDRPVSMDAVLDQLVKIQSEQGLVEHSTTAVEERTRSLMLSNDAVNKSRSASKRGKSLTITAILVAGLLCCLGYWWQGNQSYNPTGGIWFDGKTSYAVAPTFVEPIDSAVMIEVLVTPEPGPTPSNVASWTGENSIYLFVSVDSQWGVGTLIDGENRLLIVNKAFQMDETCLVAVRWDAQRMDILVNGREVETVRNEYPLVSAEPMLCFGGTPPGLLPEERGPRFFRGMIHAARVCKGELPDPAKTPDELLEPVPSAVALFRFDESHQQRAEGLIENQCGLELVNTQWIELPSK